jgi:hypothetical protein
VSADSLGFRVGQVLLPQQGGKTCFNQDKKKLLQNKTMVKKEAKKRTTAAEKNASDAHADRLEKELKDLIEVNESRSGAFSKIMKEIEKRIDKPSKT